jgi:hypothetical protein
MQEFDDKNNPLGPKKKLPESDNEAMKELKEALKKSKVDHVRIFDLEKKLKNE